MKYSIPPGVFDILPEDLQDRWKSSHLWAHVESIIRKTAQEYGFQEIRTPLFERTELFQRSVGETSDIVSKEMYTFEDKGKRSMSLRPEGTAPVMRAFIEHQLQNKSPVHKLFYIAPMFRYERAQAGRYRQHHQFGAEVIGNSSPEQDAELIDLLYTLYTRLGLKNLTLFINSIGDLNSRQQFREALKEYLKPQFELLSPDSQNRFETNPLRILDSKDPRDREIVAGAPSILDFLNEESKMHFEELKKLLTALNIPFQVNPLLVRGLDYYNKTVFEVVAGELGAQNSIGGGGRYDGLLHSLGGADLPSIGFGTGIERIIQTLINQSQHDPDLILPEPATPMVFLIPLGDQAKQKCFTILHQLRQAEIPSQMEFNNRKLGKAMQYADHIRTRYVIVMGDHELAEGEVELKEMASGHKTKVALEDLTSILKIDMKNSEWMKAIEESSQPFQSEGVSNFFLRKAEQSLEHTQEATLQFHDRLQKLQKLWGTEQDV